MGSQEARADTKPEGVSELAGDAHPLVEPPQEADGTSDETKSIHSKGAAVVHGAEMDGEEAKTLEEEEEEARAMYKMAQQAAVRTGTESGEPQERQEPKEPKESQEPQELSLIHI